MAEYSEDSQVEQPAIELFADLGWQTINAYEEILGTNGTLGRETQQEVVLTSRLKKAMQSLNPEVGESQIDEAINEVTRDRSSMHPVRAANEVYKLFRDGVPVEFRDEEGKLEQVNIRIIDWRQKENNDWLLVSQFWVSGDYGRKRPDLVAFVNGIPLIVFELKKASRHVKEAYTDNISDYKDTIPQLFWYAFVLILSNGAETKIGTLTAPWEHYGEWKKINDEGEVGVVSLETAIRGVCEKDRLLDLLEHFILFKESRGTPEVLLARNHQYLGVNNAIRAVRNLRENRGKLGVFWHTQGSGKSYSMVFFTRKILRALTGDWKFLIVTDRTDLDDQIYKNFASTGAVTEPEETIRADSREELKQLLSENHRYVFTLIQKFHTRDGEPFPVVSEDPDIIVITDEAHRTQYDVLAMNMRKALPNAAFIGFTGTPLIRGEDQKTREVFGDYVSIYDFKESIDDGATVPLYYENRIPELQLVNEKLNEDLGEVLDEAMLNEHDEEKLEREFRNEYQLITRDERLDVIAGDIVTHFLNRGYQGKAMVISIDRYTAVRMYDKVQHFWQEEIRRINKELRTAEGSERDVLLEQLNYMHETDMAVVVSQSQNEIRDFDAKGLDIRRHRERIVKEPLDEKFKDPNDPLRMVFVCAMWITGFDVPSLSTLYLDKPMKSHTLMQTIARANRVFEGKNNGLIVDYIGVFRNLQKALAVYATGRKDEDEGTMPVRNKEELVDRLNEAVEAAKAFCQKRGVDLDAIIQSSGFEQIKYQEAFAKAIVDYHNLEEEVGEAAEQVLINDSYKKEFQGHVNLVDRLYKAILPDPAAEAFLPVRSALKAISDMIKVLRPPAEDDLDDIRRKIEQVLDFSISSEGYVMDPGSDGQMIDLSRIDFDKLRERFDQSKRKHSMVELLKGTIEEKLEAMIEQNRTRMDFRERYEEMIEQYNNYSINVNVLFDELVKLVGDLDQEEQRHVKENLSEEELALFDLLVTKDHIELTDKERATVKQAVRELLDTLKSEKLVLDWRKRQRTRAQVRVTIERMLDKELPRAYTPELYNQVCAEVYNHVYERYGSGVYG